jgi:hypothetical protein
MIPYTIISWLLSYNTVQNFSCNTEHEYSPVCDDETPSPKLDEAHEDAGDYESSDSGIYKTPKNECDL